MLSLHAPNEGLDLRNKLRSFGSFFGSRSAYSDYFSRIFLLSLSLSYTIFLDLVQLNIEESLLKFSSRYNDNVIGIALNFHAFIA